MKHNVTNHASPLRRKTDPQANPALEQTIDEIAMTLCPAEEWEEYEARRHRLSRLGRKSHTAQVKVFPIWWKYRRQAAQIASVRKYVPVLRYFPMPVSSLLGELFFH